MSRNANKKIFLHAPNIHVGGGLKILESILNDRKFNIVSGDFDSRIQDRSIINKNIKSYFVKPTIPSRILAEIKLFFLQSRYTEILCLNCLPPLLPIFTNTTIIAQNRLLFDKKYIFLFPMLSRIRIFLETLWVRFCHRKQYKYIVPTESMKRLALDLLGNDTRIVVIPFTLNNPIIKKTNSGNKKFQFVYVASGEPHKNHKNLLEAWKLLSEEGIKPSLALTVNIKTHSKLAELIEWYKKEFSLKISNLGELTKKQVTDLYSNSETLIFPSLVESFGLPLMEAQQMGLPIIASDLDYVKDISNPQATFDPESQVSIARAIKNFAYKPEKKIKCSGKLFNDQLYQEIR